MTTWPELLALFAFLREPNRRAWLDQVMVYTDAADDTGVTLKQLRRGHCPYRVHFTPQEARALLESGRLRDAGS